MNIVILDCDGYGKIPEGAYPYKTTRPSTFFIDEEGNITQKFLEFIKNDFGVYEDIQEIKEDILKYHLFIDYHPIKEMIEV